jgi:hypothetical protein
MRISMRHVAETVHVEIGQNVSREMRGSAIMSHKFPESQIRRGKLLSREEMRAMRKSGIDLNEVTSTARTILHQATMDRKYAERLANDPPFLAQVLELPPGSTTVKFWIATDEYCITDPQLGLNICVPVSTTG